jgi:hypothetical protein
MSSVWGTTRRRVPPLDGPERDGVDAALLLRGRVTVAAPLPAPSLEPWARSYARWRALTLPQGRYPRV